MSIWTLASDESGKFHENERHAFLVGGVLLPKPAEQLEDLRQTLQAWCAKHRLPYPPHATALREATANELLALSAQWLSRHDGRFIGILCKRSSIEADVALHARMLGAFIELCARIGAASGATALDLRPASRGFQVKKEEATEARLAGLRVDQEKQGLMFRGVLGTEAREALDALARSARGRLAEWPKVSSVAVVSAQNETVHPGVLAADSLCNRAFAMTRERASSRRRDLTQPLSWHEKTALVVDYHLLPLVRSVDEALRHEPPQLHRAATALSQLQNERDNFVADGSRVFLGVEGAAAVAELLFVEGEQRLVEACRQDKHLGVLMAQRMAGDVESELERKHGNYAGTAKGLELGFSGKGELAQLLRDISDRELVARLYRLTLECSNHLGDVAGAEWARTGFASTLSAGASLALLGEALKLENVSLVAFQNELPCATDRAGALLADIAASAGRLRDFADKLNQPVLSFNAAPSSQPLSDDERLLRELAGSSSGWAPSNREHGRCLGTCARSLAFAGDLDAAWRLALEARSYFADFPSDLVFNACVLARIELERARTTPESTRTALIRVLMKLAQAEPLRDAARVDDALNADASARFPFDLLLRQLLWAPGVSEAGLERPLLELLAGPPTGLYQTVRSTPSHPSELIARHAAELLQRHQRKAKVVERWFQLSLELTSHSPWPTLQRLSSFTRHLAEGGVADGPPGSLLNPTFEYR